MSSNNPFSYYVKSFQNYVNFKGRASRKEYWLYFLANFIISLAILSIIPAITDVQGGKSINNAYLLVTFLPALAYGARRMHDSDHSGWWILLPVVNFIFLCFPGTAGVNRFGPSVDE